MDIMRLEHGDQTVLVREDEYADYVSFEVDESERIVNLPTGFVDYYIGLTEWLTSEQIWKMLGLWALDAIRG